MLLFPILVITLAIILFSVGLISIARINLPVILSSLYNSPNTLNTNFIESGRIGPINVNLCWYLIFLLSFLLYSATKTFSRKAHSITDPEDKQTFPHLLLSLGLCLFILSAGLQTFKLSRIFSFQRNSIPYCSIDEKRKVLFGYTYEFAQFCRHSWPLSLRAKFISSLNLTRPRDLSLYTVLSYYLYPIDIKVNTTPPWEGVVVFLRKKPEAEIPNGFKIFRFDSNSLLAIKNRRL